MISDGVTLSLTDNEMYSISTDAFDTSDYSRYFAEQVKGNPDIRLHIARISVAPAHFLTDMYAINYAVDHTVPLEGHERLRTREEGVIPSKIIFNLNRSFDWGKDALWMLQKWYFDKQEDTHITRNNAMRSESAFMEYRQAGSNDLLQEYFVPVEEFAGFVDDFRRVLLREPLNLLNVTVRYVNRDEEATLSYAREDMFALVCLFHVPLSQQGQQRAQTVIQDVLDRLLAHRGTYYLPYAAYPRLDQFREAYPQQAAFFRKKQLYDPDRIFVNNFYMDYKGE